VTALFHVKRGRRSSLSTRRLRRGSRPGTCRPGRARRRPRPPAPGRRASCSTPRPATVGTGPTACSGSWACQPARGSRDEPRAVLLPTEHDEWAVLGFPTTQPAGAWAAELRAEPSLPGTGPAVGAQRGPITSSGTGSLPLPQIAPRSAPRSRRPPTCAARLDRKQRHRAGKHIEAVHPARACFSEGSPRPTEG
jgi:hypothetical protein